MSRKRMSIVVQGRQKRWSFTFYGDPAHLPDWRADGLDVVEVVNVIPWWAARWPRAWCFAQDVFNFRNPWRQK